MNQKNLSLTESPLFSSIIRFALPIAAASLLQSLFNAADVAVVGNMSNDNAVAAVGVNAPVIGLLVNSAIGISTGTDILLARHLGAKNDRLAKLCVNTSVFVALCLGLMIGLAGFFFAPLILSGIDCPADIFDSALLYLRLYLLATPCIMLYNFGASIIRINGDSRKPLIYMVYCGVLNVVLNLILCLILPQKVAAVGIATFASQALGAFLVIRHLVRLEGPCRFVLRHPEISLSILGNIFRFGIPCAINSSLYSIANLQIQSAMNSFGTATVSGNTACSTIESLIGCFNSGFNATTLAFVGQNLGARNSSRVRNSFRISLLLNCSLDLLCSAIIYLFSDFFLGLIIPGQTLAIEFGKQRMLYVVLPYFITGFHTVFASNVRAFGYPILQTIQSVVTVLVFRFFWMFFIYPLYPTYVCLLQCFLVSWILTFFGSGIMNLIVLHRFRNGKIKKI